MEHHNRHWVVWSYSMFKLQVKIEMRVLALVGNLQSISLIYGDDFHLSPR